MSSFAVDWQMLRSPFGRMSLSYDNYNMSPAKEKYHAITMEGILINLHRNILWRHLESTSNSLACFRPKQISYQYSINVTPMQLSKAPPLLRQLLRTESGLSRGSHRSQIQLRQLSSKGPPCLAFGRTRRAKVGACLSSHVQATDTDSSHR